MSVKNTKIYKVPEIQNVMILLSLYSIHQGDMRVPIYFVTEKDIDFKLMEKVINIEIERNDSLRIRYFKKFFTLYEYFVSSTEFSFEINKDNFRDFTGRTDKELKEWLREDSTTPLRYLKGETFRIKLFICPDGRKGLFLNVFHASMDLYAVLTFYKDIMQIYDALENNTELPLPLYSYEDIVARQIEKEKDKEKSEKCIKALMDSYGADRKSFYAGIDCMKQLNKYRKKNPEQNHISSLPGIIKDSSENMEVYIDRKMTDRMYEFCKNNSVSIQNLLYIGMRTYLSSVNERTEDVTFNFLVNRRGRINEKLCGGSIVTMLPLRTIISENMSFIESLRVASGKTLDIARNVDARLMDYLGRIGKAEKRSFLTENASMMFTVCPREAFCVPEGWFPELGGISTGHFQSTAYTIVVPNPYDGGMKCFYEYRNRFFTKENLENLHNGMLKVISAGMEKPDITIGEIMDKHL